MSDMPANLFLDMEPEQFAYLAGPSPVHATNGTYMYDAHKIVPTLLAGFQYVSEKLAKPDDVLLIAVNSDVSMNQIMKAKNASPVEMAALEDQATRAMKVAGPLALQNPDRLVMVLFYDENTPKELYESLRDKGVALSSLQKWDYGTKPDAPKIVGAELFGTVLAFPLPNDTRPVCYDLTPVEDQSALIDVIKLTENTGKHGAPYISSAGNILFPAGVKSLDVYTQSYADAQGGVQGGTPPIPNP